MSLYLFVLILGVVQGATEFLPISSSGHLAFVENLPWFHFMKDGIEQRMSLLAFNIFLHIGTILAVLVFFLKDLLRLAGSLPRFITFRFEHRDARMLRAVFIASLPLLAVPFYKGSVEDATGDLRVIAFLFIINGIILMAGDYIARKNREYREVEDAGYAAPLLIGLAQCVAVFPGISRSGATIAAGLGLRLNGPDAVRFSFLMSVPALIGATLFEVRDVLKTHSFAGMDIPLVLTGVGASFVTGLASLGFLVYLARKVRFTGFGIYTILLGLILLMVN